jgi:hypothetical protein
MPFRIKLGPPRNRSRLAALMGGLICLGLCGVGLFVLLGGAELSGGIPFVPDVINRGIGRLMLIFGIVLTGLLSVYALWELWLLHRERHQ